MYSSFRHKPRYLGCLECFNDFTNACTSFNKSEVEKSSKKLFLTTGRKSEYFYVFLFIILIQDLVSCKARRRSRGEMSVLTNKMNHITNGNRSHYLDCLFQNVPGKQSKQKDKQIAIETILERFRPALLGIAEPQTEDLEKMRIRGYSVIKGKLKRGRKVRLNVLVKEGVEYKIENFCSEIPASLIKIDKFKFLFYYREWRKEGKKDTDKMVDQELRWLDFLDKVDKIKGPLVMMGDSNVCDINEESAHQRSLNGIREMIRERLVGAGKTQMVKYTTRHMPGQTAACLDHVYTKEGKHIARTFNQNATGFDHNMIGVRVRTDRPVFIPRTIVEQNVDIVDPLVFHRVWHMINPWEVMNENDPEKAAEILEFKINSAVDIVAPKKIYQARESYAPWMDEELRKRKIKRDMMHAEAVTSGEWHEYKEYKARLRNDLRKAEWEWKNNYLNVEGDKEGWRRLKVMAGANNQKTDIVLNVDGEETDDPQIVAETLNNFYVDKVDNIVKECPPDPVAVIDYMAEYMENKEIGRFKFHTVGDGEVRRAVMKLNSSEATGLDGIKVKWLKRFVHTLTPFLRHVVNRTIITGQYPDRYKAGCISPLPKKGDLKLARNWRPVVLLSTCSRVVERVLNKQMKDYLEAWSLLPSTQHAYRRGKSCVSAWSDLDFFVSRARDEHRHVSMICQDMSSAFNTVDKEVIIPKLKMMGFQEEALTLMSSYMTGRTNRTRVQNHVTGPRHVYTGIGEGSVFGPATFLICVINVDVVLARTRARVEAMFPELKPEDLRIHVCSFADDISGLVDSTCPNVMRATLDIMSEEYRLFFTAQGLKVNQEKEEHITWGKSPKDRAEVTLSGRDSAGTVKLLGVTVDNNYSFMPHVSAITRRMMERVSYLYRVRDYVSAKILNMLARSLIFSIQEYAIEVWGRAQAVQKKLQKTMNIVLRVITHGDRMTRVSGMLASTGFLNINLTHKYYCCMSIERLLLHRGSSLEYEVVKKGQSHQYHTRTTMLLAEWRPYGMIGYNSHLLTSLKVYNQLRLNNVSWPNDDFDEYKKLIREKLLRMFENGNI